MKNPLLVKVRGFIIEIFLFIVFMGILLVFGWVIVILRWFSGNLSLKAEVKKLYNELIKDECDYGHSGYY